MFLNKSGKAMAMRPDPPCEATGRDLSQRDTPMSLRKIIRIRPEAYAWSVLSKAQDDISTRRCDEYARN
jgi:hypothetical protein